MGPEYDGPQTITEVLPGVLIARPAPRGPAPLREPVPCVYAGCGQLAVAHIGYALGHLYREAPDAR